MMTVSHFERMEKEVKGLSCAVAHRDGGEGEEIKDSILFVKRIENIILSLKKFLQSPNEFY